MNNEYKNVKIDSKTNIGTIDFTNVLSVNVPTTYHLCKPTYDSSTGVYRVQIPVKTLDNMDTINFAKKVWEIEQKVLTDSKLYFENWFKTVINGTNIMNFKHCISTITNELSSFLYNGVLCFEVPESEINSIVTINGSSASINDLLFEQHIDVTFKIHGIIFDSTSFKLNMELVKISSESGDITYLSDVSDFSDD